jgi:fructose/tagatose bisphosphate aldolase
MAAERAHDVCRVADVREQPLVLHGASSLAPDQVAVAERYGAKLPHAQGIPPDLIRKAVTLGIAKVNTDSGLAAGGCSDVYARCWSSAPISSTSTS